MDNTWIPSSKPSRTKVSCQRQSSVDGKGVDCRGASMILATHTPGCSRERDVMASRVERKVRFGCGSERLITGRHSSERLRWNRCSVRIVRVSACPDVSASGRGRRAGTKPRHALRSVPPGEHAQGWRHGSCTSFRWSCVLGTNARRPGPLGGTHCPVTRQRAASASWSGRHVRFGVPLRPVAGPLRPALEGRCGCGPEWVLRLPLAGVRVPAIKDGGGSRSVARGSCARPCDAGLSDPGRPSSAHDRARPQGFARRVSHTDRSRNRLGGFAP